MLYSFRQKFYFCYLPTTKSWKNFKTHSKNQSGKTFNSEFEHCMCKFWYFDKQYFSKNSPQFYKKQHHDSEGQGLTPAVL